MYEGGIKGRLFNLMVLRRGLEPLRLVHHHEYYYKVLIFNILNIIEHS